MTSLQLRDRQHNWDMFAEDNKAMAAFLNSILSWNRFAKSLVCSIEEFGTLTSGQKNALTKMMEKAK